MTAGSEEFARSIARLNSEGGSILVTGPAPPEAHVRACESFCGAADGPSRRRAFALVGDGTPGPERRLPEGAETGPGHLAVVRAQYHTRSAAADANGAEVPGPNSPREPDDEATSPIGYRETVGPDVSALTSAVEGALADLVAAGSVEPSELRLCVDGLEPLLVEHDRGAVLEFCHRLARILDRHDGLGHFHLPLPSDHEAVSALVPSFDVVVALRVRDGAVEQHWTTRDGAESGWIPL